MYMCRSEAFWYFYYLYLCACVSNSLSLYSLYMLLLCLLYEFGIIAFGNFYSKVVGGLHSLLSVDKTNEFKLTLVDSDGFMQLSQYLWIF